jgi:hypothetical protein
LVGFFACTVVSLVFIFILRSEKPFFHIICVFFVKKAGAYIVLRNPDIFHEFIR